MDVEIARRKGKRKIAKIIKRRVPPELNALLSCLDRELREYWRASWCSLLADFENVTDVAGLNEAAFKDWLSGPSPMPLKLRACGLWFQLCEISNGNLTPLDVEEIGAEATNTLERLTKF